MGQGRGQDVSKNLRTATHVRSRICLVFEFHPTWLLRLRFCEGCRDLLRRSLWTPTSTPLGSWWSRATFDLADTHIRPPTQTTSRFTFDPTLIKLRKPYSLNQHWAVRIRTLPHHFRLRSRIGTANSTLKANANLYLALGDLVLN